MTRDFGQPLQRRDFLVRGARFGGGLVLAGAAADLLAAVPDPS
jgi:hypothetical protein